jgi:anti-sigma factor ChrR (cupin superfamily)
MPEHLPSQMIELFVARKLAPADLLTAAQHLAVCETCRQQSNRLRHTGSAIEHLQAQLQEALPESGHLSYEQLAAFVDATLQESEGQMISLHLVACAACAKEAQELELLKNSLLTGTPAALEIQTGLAAKRASAVIGEAQSGAKPSAGFWQTVVGFLQTKPLQSALASAVVLLAILAASYYLSRPIPQNQTAESNDSNISPSTNSSNQSAKTPTTQGNQNESIARQNPDASANNNAPHPPTNQQKNRDNPHADRAGKRIEIPINIGENAFPATLPPAYESVIKQAMANQAIARPAIIAELAGKTSNLMSKKSEGESFALSNPVGTVVQNEQPTFRWQALPEATSYTVYILDLNFHILYKSHPLSTNLWTIPQALERGAVYVWQVTATKNGREITSPSAPMPEARFKILEQAKAGELQRLAKERAGSHLILGVIYAHNGLLDEAEREFQTAIDKNQDADRAKRLLQSLKALR